MKMVNDIIEMLDDSDDPQLTLRVRQRRVIVDVYSNIERCNDLLI